ncbi:oxygen-independent coproporphyrinogen III oxidase [Thermincola ferriacetica]|uniref:Heme chaperone HemW n=1 Tax=Thermincola ferriacetica TaxID=281456 RepID=A0A0L6VZS4_9FIRM|nr:radical SAM family heme chaperone HemW [Thermincola ferriacetica]KNZ68827.1 oxygen-independent coproporphyrinogen III oxidase [Thermincola ferriacetica]
MAIGLYIHVPFCVKKCNYCDFISYPYDAGLTASYVSALLKEIELYGQQLSGKDKELASVYIGGGTPSLLSVPQLEAVFGNLGRFFDYVPGAEVTVEANPGTLDREKLNNWKAFGCNRLSIGMQSMNDSLLRFLGRIHRADEAAHAFYLAREAGFDNINIDLIFGIPGQGMHDWSDTLRRVLELGPEHISAYGLKIEEGTPLARLQAEGQLPPGDEDLEVEMYFHTIDTLRAAGYEHYEISNFCRPGKASAHNLRYWANKEYLGLGPAAHSYLHGVRFSNRPGLNEYCTALNDGLLPVAERNPVDRHGEISETIFLGLRLINGLNLKDFRQRFGQSIEELFPAALDKLERLGLVEKRDVFLRLTRKGLPLANEVFAEFV